MWLAFVAAFFALQAEIRRRKLEINPETVIVVMVMAGQLQCPSDANVRVHCRSAELLVLVAARQACHPASTGSGRDCGGVPGAERAGALPGGVSADQPARVSGHEQCPGHGPALCDR